MLKKLIIFCFVLLVAGAAGLVWVQSEERRERQRIAWQKVKDVGELEEFFNQYNKWLQLPADERDPLPWGLDKYGNRKKEAQLGVDQEARLKTDLDRLAAGKRDVYPFADVYYGESWREELRKYKGRKELKEYILTGSIVCVCAGGAIFAYWLLLRLVRVVGGVLAYFRKCFFGGRPEAGDEQPGETAVEGGEGNSQRDERRVTAFGKRELKGAEPQKKSGKLRKVLMSSGWRSFGEGNGHEKGREKVASDDRAKRLAVLLSDEESRGFEERREVGVAGPAPNTTQFSRSTQATNQGTFSRTHKYCEELEDSIEGQRRELEREVDEVKQRVGFASCKVGKGDERCLDVRDERSPNGKCAVAMRRAAAEDSEPLRDSLRELTEQISAIREYASHQQDRMERLQDGYDWNIIRTFCLKVIRCIDNIESRVGQLSREDIQRGHLEEIRDELIFALESSGIEQFEPEVSSDYRGQEKTTEAVKDKECPGEPNMKGKIAEVIRPGYQYVVGEESVKIVRTAQVRLFG